MNILIDILKLASIITISQKKMAEKVIILRCEEVTKLTMISKNKGLLKTGARILQKSEENRNAQEPGKETKI